MAQVFFNVPPTTDKDGKILWCVKRSIWKPQLVIEEREEVNHLDSMSVEASIYIREDHGIGGGAKYIYLMKPEESDDRILGIYISENFPYEMTYGKQLYVACTCAVHDDAIVTKVGVYELGSVILQKPYKNKGELTSFKLTRNGWKQASSAEIFHQTELFYKI